MVLSKDGSFLYYAPYARGDVEIPEGVKTIGEGAFLGCSGLTGVYIPESVIEIQKNAFSRCSSLTSVTIPAGVAEIVDGTFSGCTALKNISLSEGLTFWGRGFYRLYELD